MKRLLPVFTLALLLLMLLATPALAIEGTYNGKEVFEPSTEQETLGQYTITHNDAAISAEGQYLLLIVKGLHDSWDDYLAANNNSMKITDVTYVDQTTAESGKVSYSGLIPYVQPNSTVFVSGDAYSQPELVGYIGAGTMSFSVTHNQYGVSVPTAALSTTEDVPVKTPVVSSSAKTVTTFATVYEGSYTLTVAKPGCLSITITDIPLDAEFEMEDLMLYGGDINSDGYITLADFNLLLKVYNIDNSKVNWSDTVEGNGTVVYAYADINDSYLEPNGDYVCSLADFSAFANSFGQKSFSGTYAEWLAGGNE